MEKEQLIKAIMAATSVTLEGMAFAEVDEYRVMDSVAEVEEDGCLASIPILEPREGRISIIIGNQFADELLDAILGEEVAESKDKLFADVISEIINTIAGRFMAFLLDEKSDFALGLPACTALKEGAKIEKENEDEILISCLADENTFFLKVAMN